MQPQMQPQMQMLPQMPPQMQQQLYSAQQVQQVQHVQQLHSAGRQPVPVQIASPLPAQQPIAQPRPAGLRGAADTTAFSRVEAAPFRPVAAAGQAAAAGAASGAAVPLPAASPSVGVERGAGGFPEGAVVEGLATLTSDMSDEVKSAALSW